MPESVRAALALLPLLCLTACLSGCSLFSKGGPGQNPWGDADESAAAMQGEPVPYTVSITTEGEYSGPDPAAAMREHSQLVRLEAQPPDSLLGLERRARGDKDTAVELLHSLGYFDGEADWRMESAATSATGAATGAATVPAPAPTASAVAESAPTEPVQVSLVLRPGRLYTVGLVSITYEPKPVVPEEFLRQTREVGLIFRRTESLPGPQFPQELSRVNIGDPAAADALLDDIAALPPALHRQGYPYAKVAGTRFLLNKDAGVLEAHVSIDPGPPAFMDGVEVRGENKVDAGYIRHLAPWKAGAPWNADQVAAYRETLQKLGLFSVVEVTVPPSERVAEHLAESPSESVAENPAGHTPAPVPEPVPGHAADAPAPPTQGHAVTPPVMVRVTEAPFRSVSAGARYTTDIGFGVQAGWEHRNLLGAGEKLTTKALIAQNEQSLNALFEKPAFLRTDQKLLADAFLGREKTDAYDKRTAAASAGLERRLTPAWWAEARAIIEAGSERDDDESHQYRLVSLRAGARRDTRDNVFNPTRGSLFSASIQPYTGFYDGPFQTTVLKLDGSAYYAPFKNDRLVFAGRMAMGGMFGANRDDMPASLRFFQGGGGTVRGYPYQGIGPRDSNNDPLGGRSFQQVNLETRFKITESIGLVPFVDGGMVYADQFPPMDFDLDWAVGLGLRYFTPIGPVRLDVAFPLTHYQGDDRFQLYISIGQAF